MKPRRFELIVPADIRIAWIDEAEKTTPYFVQGDLKEPLDRISAALILSLLDANEGTHHAAWVRHGRILEAFDDSLHSQRNDFTNGYDAGYRRGLSERAEHSEQPDTVQQGTARAKESLVYLIEAGTRYKIGITTNLNKRISQLSKQAPFPLRVVHTVTCENAWKVEQQLHEVFEDQRRHGEWFEFDPDEIAAVIEAMQDATRATNDPAMTTSVHAE